MPDKVPEDVDIGVELHLVMASEISPLLTKRNLGMYERTLAELTFANLWLFRRSHKWKFHEGDWPCISGVGYDGLKHATPLFDLRDASHQVVDSLLEKFGCLFPLSDVEIELISTDRYRVESIVSDSDYLYPAKQFQHYQGSALHNKKNLMTQFLNSYEVSVAPFTQSIKNHAEEILDAWMKDKSLGLGEADELPCRDAIAVANQLGLEGYVYYANHVAAGFILSEELQPGVWVIRFAKGLARFKGISQFMFHHFATCADRNVNWLNFEQDLGLSNFRQTKQSYQPSHLLSKWRLHLP
jgi:hypothetical protein